jgi:hypothetical protein
LKAYDDPPASVTVVSVDRIQQPVAQPGKNSRRMTGFVRPGVRTGDRAARMASDGLFLANQHRYKRRPIFQQQASDRRG